MAWLNFGFGGLIGHQERLDDQHDCPCHQKHIRKVEGSPVEAAVEENEIEKISDGVNFTVNAFPAVEAEAVVEIPQRAGQQQPGCDRQPQG